MAAIIKPNLRLSDIVAFGDLKLVTKLFLKFIIKLFIPLIAGRLIIVMIHNLIILLQYISLVDLIDKASKLFPILHQYS